MSDSEQSTPQVTKVGTGRITTATSGSLSIPKFSPEGYRRDLAGTSGHSMNGLYSERTQAFLDYTGTADGLFREDRTYGSPPSPPPVKVIVTYGSCWAKVDTTLLPADATDREITACSQAGPSQTCSGASFRNERTERRRLYDEGFEPRYQAISQDERLKLHNQDLYGDTVDGPDPASLASFRLPVKKVVAHQED